MRRWGALFCCLLLAGCAGCGLSWEREGDSLLAHESGEGYTLTAQLPVTAEKMDRCLQAAADEGARAFLRALEERKKKPELPDVPGAWQGNGEASEYGRLLSAALTEYTYLPGDAHGAYRIRTFLLDTQRERFLTLPDLFIGDPYEALSEIAYWGLIESGQLGDYVDPAWIASGTEPKASNFSDFLVGEEGLTLIFAPYQIGPWVLGEQRLLIPWSRLEGLLREEYFGK